MNEHQNLIDSNFLSRVQEQDLGGIKHTLEELGANVNTKVLKGSSAIHLLLTNQYPSTEILKYLIKKGADINKKNESGQTPIEISAISFKPNVIIELLKHCPEINSADLSTLKQIVNCNNNTSISLPCKIKNIYNFQAAVDELETKTQSVSDFINRLNSLETKYIKLVPEYFNRKFQTGYKCEQAKIKDIVFLHSFEPCLEVGVPLAQLLLDLQNNIGRMLLHNLSKSSKINVVEERTKLSMDESIAQHISSWLLLEEQAQAISLVAGLPVLQICPKEDAMQKLTELAESECTGKDSLDSAT